MPFASPLESILNLFGRVSRPWAGGLFVIVAVALATAACDRLASPETRLKKAQAQIAAGNVRFAEAELQTVVRDAPDNVDARIALADVALTLGDPSLADQQLSRAEALHVPAD